MSKKFANPEEQIKAGVLFSPAEPELVAIKRRTHNLNVDYNQTHEDEFEKREAILREIIGEVGEGVRIQGPIAFHYGKHTKIGRNFFANFNFTVQDDGEVTIGDYCNFGPNVTIVTPVHPMVASERRAMLTAEGEAKTLCYAKPVHIGSDCWFGGMPWRYHWGRLRYWRGQCGDPGYPGKQLCRRGALSGNPGDYRGGQHGAYAPGDGGQPDFGYG